MTIIFPLCGTCNRYSWGEIILCTWSPLFLFLGVGGISLSGLLQCICTFVSHAVSARAPSLTFLTFFSGLSLFAETAYGPSLPRLAKDFACAASMAEYTMTAYLLSFSAGVLFWGILSDRMGRVPCTFMGLYIFMAGCFMCYTAPTISMFFLARFVQGFGAAVGSALSQAITRDAFKGKSLAKVYASVGAAMSLFPILGPFVGGILADCWSWRGIFLFLIAVTLVLRAAAHWALPETHPVAARTPLSVGRVALSLVKDPSVLAYGVILSLVLGMNFSYVAESPFVLKEMLCVSPSHFVYTFIPIGLCASLGGINARLLQNRIEPIAIVGIGLCITFGATIFFSTSILSYALGGLLSKQGVVYAIVLSQMIGIFGNAFVISNVLALALAQYKDQIGTASSLFGSFYYALVALVTWGMGKVHNGTLYSLPFYFFFLALTALSIYVWMRRSRSMALRIAH